MRSKTLDLNPVAFRRLVPAKRGPGFAEQALEEARKVLLRFFFPRKIGHRRTGIRPTSMMPGMDPMKDGRSSRPRRDEAEAWTCWTSWKIIEPGALQG